MRFLAKLLFDETAATSVEYAVVLAMILLVVLAAVQVVGTQTSTLWGNIATSIESPP